jgi:hypothetical protein
LNFHINSKAKKAIIACYFWFNVTKLIANATRSGGEK